jgi:hypothetical protein
MVVALRLDHFGGKVVECATERCAGNVSSIATSTPPEICDLQDILVRHEEVLWLDVSMYKSILVQIIQTLRYLAKILTCKIFRETAILLRAQDLIKLALRTIL